MNVKNSHKFIINSMNVSRFVFFRFEKHLDDNSVESADFWHSCIFLGLNVIFVRGKYSYFILMFLFLSLT